MASGGLFFPNFASLLPSPEAAVTPPPPDNTLPFAIGSFLKSATKAVSEWRDAEDHKQELNQFSEYFDAKGLPEIAGLLRKRAATFRPNFFGDPDQVSKSRGSILKSFLELGKEELDAQTATSLKNLELEKYSLIHGDSEYRLQAQDDRYELGAQRQSLQARLNSLDQELSGYRTIFAQAAKDGINPEGTPEWAKAKEVEAERARIMKELGELRLPVRERPRTPIIKSSGSRRSRGVSSIINTPNEEPPLPTGEGEEAGDGSILLTEPEGSETTITVDDADFPSFMGRPAITPSATPSEVPKIRVPIRSGGPVMAPPANPDYGAAPVQPAESAGAAPSIYKQRAAGQNKKIETIKLPTRELIKIGTNVATDAADKNTLARLEAQLEAARTPQEITAIGRAAAIINKKYAPARGATYEFTPIIQTNLKDSNNQVWIVSRKNDKTGSIEYGISYTGEDISKLDISVISDITGMSESEILSAAANVQKVKVANPQLTETGLSRISGINTKQPETTKNLAPYQTQYTK